MRVVVSWACVSGKMARCTKNDCRSDPTALRAALRLSQQGIDNADTAISLAVR